ncbi:MAG: hypothetical protein PHZ24_09120 [Bacteroidales bacterium]|jgi:hypothetical protein|nr:hypothetical protein [Bacteroidales bacterium]MDY0143021.1 hypothetical protein [Bacteroidales bacterium]
MNKIIQIIAVIIAFLSLSNITISQTSNGYLEAKNHIVRLHDSSILLVRLQTKEHSLQIYRNASRHKFADKKELGQKTLNQQIVNAFRKNFNFCEVYFFYSNESSNIIEQKFHETIFLNDSLQKTPSIKPNFEDHYYYIAEFKTITSETGIQGLIIMDSEFKQLDKPFPYYAKNPFFASKSKFAFTTVKRFNENLHNYYNSCK